MAAPAKLGHAELEASGCDESKGRCWTSAVWDPNEIGPGKGEGKEGKRKGLNFLKNTQTN
jgi:hypothetical protein